jgi:hypothetical protein
MKILTKFITNNTITKCINNISKTINVWVLTKINQNKNILVKANTVKNLNRVFFTKIQIT